MLNVRLFALICTPLVAGTVRLTVIYDKQGSSKVLQRSIEDLSFWPERFRLDPPMLNLFQ